MKIFFGLLFCLNVSIVHAALCLRCNQETDQECPVCHIPFCQDCFSSSSAYQKHRQREERQSQRRDCLKHLSESLKREKSTLPEAGQGLFAKKIIPPGAVVAIYTGEEHDRSCSQLKFFTAVLVDEQHRHPYTQEIAHVDPVTKNLIRNPHHYIVGYREAEELGAFAQGVNDAGMSAKAIRFLKTVAQEQMIFEDFQKISNLFYEYYYRAMSTPQHNVILRNEPFSSLLPFPYLVSVKEILENQEIFYYYGVEYWANLAHWNCYRKGLLVQSAKIRRAIAEGLERAKYDLIQQCGTFPVEFKIFQKYLGYPQKQLDSKHPVARFVAPLRAIFEDTWSDLCSTLTQYPSSERTKELIRFYSHVNAVDYQIPGLFFSMNTCLLYVRDRHMFHEILEAIHFKDRMREIAHLPEDAFFQGMIENTPADLSKALLVDLFKELAARAFVGPPPFQFYIPEIEPKTFRICVATHKNPPTIKQSISFEMMKQALKLVQ